MFVLVAKGQYYDGIIILCNSNNIYQTLKKSTKMVNYAIESDSFPILSMCMILVTGTASWHLHERVKRSRDPARDCAIAGAHLSSPHLAQSYRVRGGVRWSYDETGNVVIRVL